MRLLMREHKRATGNYDVADSQEDSYTSDEVTLCCLSVYSLELSYLNVLSVF